MNAVPSVQVVEPQQPEQLVQLARELARIGPPRSPIPGEERAQALGDFRDREEPLDAGQIDARVVDKRLDPPQPTELLARVHAHTADRAGWAHEAKTFV